jgi:hypothetical protein
VGQAHHEHPQLDPGPGDGGVELAEVDLGLRTGLVGLRHCHLAVIEAELDLAAGDVTGHFHLGQARAVLGDQLLPDPPGRMPLLTRHLAVGDQPAVDDLRVLIDRWPPSRRIRPARRRGRIRQRLPHGAPMQAMPLGQLADRELLDPLVSSDLLEQLHPGPRHLRPPRRQHRRADRNGGGANIRDDTLHPPSARSPPRWSRNS